MDRYYLQMTSHDVCMLLEKESFNLEMQNYCCVRIHVRIQPILAKLSIDCKNFVNGTNEATY